MENENSAPKRLPAIENDSWIQPDQIEQNDSYLENRHPGVVNRVELIVGKMEPSAMNALNPIVRKREEQEPCQQYSVVDHRTPQKKVAGERFR